MEPTYQTDLQPQTTPPPAPTEPTEPTTPADEPDTEGGEIALDEINELGDAIKRYFPDTPDQLAIAGQLLARYREVLPSDALRLNFDVDADFPEGYGIITFPVGEIIKGVGRVAKSVVFAAVPTLNSVLAHEAGRQFVEKAVLEAFSAKLKSAVDDGSAQEPPFTLEQFLKRRPKAETLATFKEIAGQFVSALKAMGLKRMNAGTLRQILSSTAYAKQHYPKISQDDWVMLLGAMKEVAKSKGLPVAIFDKWLADRDKAQVEADVEGLDFDTLTEALSGTEAAA